MKSRITLLSLVVCAAAALTFSLSGASVPACDSGNGGIQLPEGFCALVAADGVGTARHIAIAPNGDAYVAVQGKGGVVALRDKDGDGKFEIREQIGEGSSTGVALRNGYLWVATTTGVLRYKMTAGELKPAGAAETVVMDLPAGRAHQDKGIAFDGKGGLYLNVGAPSNACQNPDRKELVPGQDPCPLPETQGGIWRFDESKLNQKQSDGTRFATGLRQMPAITWHDGALYSVMNNRDQMDTLWGAKFTAQENAERPAEPMYRATQGANFGWPYCLWDYGQKKFLLNPEYGGDGKTVGRCTEFTPPVAAFPAHWAPVDVMFYEGKQFPAKYKGGAFIAFHGSWNRAPLPQAESTVTFQPFSGGKPSGAFEVFAKGLSGKTELKQPNDAMYRADGVGEGPDGSLYITDSQKGRIWRVFYRGK